MIIPEMPSQFMWISAERARHIRSRCHRVGIPMALISVAAGVLILTGGGSGSKVIGVKIFGEISVFFFFLAAISLVRSKPYVSGEYLNLTGARIARRGPFALWAGTVLASGIALLDFSLTIGNPRIVRYHPELHWTPGMAVYAVVLVVPCVLTLVTAIVTYKLFKAPFYTGPPPITGWRPSGPVAG